MRLFRTRPLDGRLVDPAALVVRHAARECSSCGQERALYVYANDGRDYCVPCARDLWVTAGLRPAGRRHEDVKFEELLQYELGGPRKSAPATRSS